MTRHELKVHPQFWEALKSNAKPFEVRRDDRKYRIGDQCVLKLYDPSVGFIACEPQKREITYILKHEDFPNGVPLGFVVLGFGKDGYDDGK